MRGGNMRKAKKEIKKQEIEVGDIVAWTTRDGNDPTTDYDHEGEVMELHTGYDPQDIAYAVVKEGNVFVNVPLEEMEVVE